jgi:hypothetical protein
VAQIVYLVERSDSPQDVQLTDRLEVVIVADPPPQDCVYRWEDDGGAVLPALELAA